MVQSQSEHQLGSEYLNQPSGAAIRRSDSDYRSELKHYLSPDQQDLLMAALSSNDPQRHFYSSSPASKQPISGLAPRPSVDFPLNDEGLVSLNPANDIAPQTQYDDFSLDVLNDGSLDDLLDTDASFLPGADDNGEQDTSGLLEAGAQPDAEGDIHEKRKNPNDLPPEEEGGNKRRENDDKVTKKAGRKPLTSEPTSKRKAQNRAAQRAFRERKEKHLKDLETKVTELERASESTNHENSLLRAQVDRLQTELREYRRRLSLNGSGVKPRSQLNAGHPTFVGKPLRAEAAPSFQFDFPRFGTFPHSQTVSNGSLGRGNLYSPNMSEYPAISAGVPGVLARDDRVSSGIPSKVSATDTQTVDVSPPKAHSPVASLSSTDSGFAGIQTHPQQRGGRRSTNSSSPLARNGTTTAVSGVSSSATATKEGQTAPANVTSSASQSRVFRFNSGSTASTTESPSESSVSQYGPTSSCETTPEPVQGSPATGKPGDLPYPSSSTAEGFQPLEEEGQYYPSSAGVKKPLAPPDSRVSLGLSSRLIRPALGARKLADNVNGIDWFASQNGGQFDPALFGSYRDSQDAIVGDGDFTGGFFTDAFPIDFGSPLGFAEMQSPPSTSVPGKINPTEEYERPQDGADGQVMPAEDRSQLLSCHQIWDTLQARPDVAEDKFDIDGLCSELRAKARCSESGVVVEKRDFDAALHNMPATTPEK